MSSGLDFPCPYCPCIFCSEFDLNLHLDVFGRSSAFHGRKFRRVHFDVELTLSCEHGVADKIVGGFKDVILSYRKNLIKHGVKCYVDKDGLISSSLDDFVGKSDKVKGVKGLDKI